MIKKQSRSPVQKTKEPETNLGKLSLYPLSVEDALRAAARTGRDTPAKPKQPNRGRKKRAIAT